MIVRLADRIVQKKQLTDTTRIREAYGSFCGIAGILFNLLLFAAKALIGLLSGSIAILADAFNNLSDAGSSLITLIGFRLASQKPDPGHPFGHGRMEYISGLIVSMIILLMGFELLRTSFEKILHPELPEWSPLILVILLLAILVKFYMAYYNRTIGRKIQSPAIQAAATDSISDCLATALVLIATVVGHFAHLAIDGWCGLLVSFFILYAGIQSAKDTINPLLGQAPDPEFIQSIHRILAEYPDICGIHDLIVHNYGPGRVMISLHAEVPSDSDLVTIHEIIDQAERRLGKELHCAAVIHMDPIATHDEHVLQLRTQTSALLCELDERLRLHDFRIVPGKTQTNLIFDIECPSDLMEHADALTAQLEHLVKERLGAQYHTIVTVDSLYV